MYILFLFLVFFDFAFLNFVAIAYIYSIIKLNKIKKDLGGFANVDLSSIGVK